jgi:hypothetical protein
MICPFCKEEIADGAIKCKHCSSMLPIKVADGEYVLASSDAHARIDALPISAALKQKLHFVHDHFKGFQLGGLGRINYGKISMKERWSMHSVWAFLLSWIYYLAKGMWRKAIILFLINILLVLLLPLNLSPFAQIGVCLSASQSAYPDIYRKEILREVFWW